jgi:hypothetical protein
MSDSLEPASPSLCFSDGDAKALREKGHLRAVYSPWQQGLLPVDILPYNSEESLRAGTIPVSYPCIYHLPISLHFFLIMVKDAS